MTTPTRPLVTIAIPTFNRADGYLRDALQSAIAQTYPNLEIIVADNCSSDNTGEVVQAFGDQRVRYIRHDRNIGAINNWNSTLEAARGAYFLMLHDDDLIDADLVGACMDAAKDSVDLGLIRTGIRIIDGRGATVSQRRNQVQGDTVADLFFSWFAGRTSLYIPSTVYNTRRLREIGGFGSKKNLLLDCVATARLAAYGWTDVADVKASFRRHQDNMGSAAKVADWADDSLYLLDVITALAPESDAELRRMGMPFLCRQNYSRAARIENWRERWAAYSLNYKAFGYTSSPIRFFYRKQVRRFKNAAKPLQASR